MQALVEKRRGRTWMRRAVVYVYVKKGLVRHTGFALFDTADRRSYRIDYGPLFADDDNDGAGGLLSAAGDAIPQAALLCPLTPAEVDALKAQVAHMRRVATFETDLTIEEIIDRYFNKDPLLYDLFENNCRHHCREVFARLAEDGVDIDRQATDLIDQIEREDKTFYFPVASLLLGGAAMVSAHGARAPPKDARPAISIASERVPSVAIS